MNFFQDHNEKLFIYRKEKGNGSQDQIKLSDNSKYLDKKGLFDTIHPERLVITNLAGSALGHIFPDPPRGFKMWCRFLGAGGKNFGADGAGVQIFGADPQD